jgi:hypothetical protein
MTPMTMTRVVRACAKSIGDIRQHQVEINQQLVQIEQTLQQGGQSASSSSWDSVPFRPRFVNGGNYSWVSAALLAPQPKRQPSPPRPSVALVSPQPQRPRPERPPVGPDPGAPASKRPRGSVGSYCRSGSRRPSAAKPGQVVVTQLVAAGAQGAHHVAPGHVNQGPRAQGWLSESTLQRPLQCQRLSYNQASKLTPPTLMPPWGRRHQCHHGRRSGWRRQRQQSRTKSRTKSRTPQQAHKHRNHRQT